MAGEQEVSRPGPYQEADWEVVDYQYYRRRDMPLRYRWRGPDPRPLEPGGYFSTLGAAQTLGRFCPEPYPNLVSESIDMPVLNLAYSGAGPRFYLNEPSILGPVNEGAFAVVQVMSGRSEGNSLMRCDSGRNIVVWEPTGEECFTERAFRLLLDGYDTDTVIAVVAETRENWLRHMTELLEAITVPTVLIWLSTRRPDYTPRYDLGLDALFGGFPHLVDRAMIDELRRSADHYVQAVSKRGHPMALRSRFTGKKVKVRMPDGRMRPKSPDYPSAKMHRDFAKALIPVARELAGR